MRQGERHRHVRHGDPRTVGDGGQLLHDVELPLDLRAVLIELGGDRPTPFAIACGTSFGRAIEVSAAVSARQPPTTEGRPHQHPEPVLLGNGKHIAFDVAHEDRVRGLLGPEARETASLGHRLGVHQLPTGVGGRPERPDRAGTLEIGQRCQRLFDIRLLLRAMHLVEVEMVRSQPAQARFDGAHDPHTGVAAIVRTGTHGVVELRRQHDLVPTAHDGLADDLLGLTVRVHVGGIDEVDPGVQRLMHRADALVVILVAPRPEGHRAQAVGAHADAGSSEDPIFHRSTLRPLAATVKGVGAVDAGNCLARSRPGGAVTGSAPSFQDAITLPRISPPGNTSVWTLT